MPRGHRPAEAALIIPTSVHWRSQLRAAAVFLALVGLVSWNDQAGRLDRQRVSGAVAQLDLGVEQPEEASMTTAAAAALPRRTRKESRPCWCIPVQAPPVRRRTKERPRHGGGWPGPAAPWEPPGRPTAAPGSGERGNNSNFRLMNRNAAPVAGNRGPATARMPWRAAIRLRVAGSRAGRRRPLRSCRTQRRS
jgi:hypothetical protein